MSESPDLRASDAEREEAAAALRDHFAAGRLSADELSERLETIYNARTAGELAAARADLPALPAVVADRRRAELGQRRAQLQRELIQQTGGGLVPFLVCAVIWAATGAHGAFWPAWVALAALVPLLRNGWHLYGPAPELDRVEADLARRREHHEHHERAGHGGHGRHERERDGRRRY